MNNRTPCECEFCWKFHRLPRYHPPQLISVIEANADSANQALVNDNKELALDRLHRIIAISRNIIRELPDNSANLRCRYRNTLRERCNRPIDGNSCVEGHPFMKHEDLQDWFPKYNDMMEEEV